MEQTYQIKHRTDITCDTGITIRRFLWKLIAAFADVSEVNLDILTIYDEPRRRVLDQPFATLGESYLSTQRLHLCYHVPGAFLMTDQQNNNGITYSAAYEAISDPMYIPLYVNGKYIYPTVSGHCTLGNFISFMQKRGFLPKSITSMTVHECFCWNSVPGATFDLTPGSPDLGKKLNRLNLYAGPPIYCELE